MEVKPRGIYVAAFLACALLASFAAGRYMAPERVVEVEKQVVVEVERQVVVERLNERKVEELSLQIQATLNQLSQLKKRIHRETKSVTYPDGRTETMETVDVNVDRTVQTTEVVEVEKQVVVEVEKVVDRVVEVEKQVVVEVEREKLVEVSRPNWRLGPMVGVNLKEFGVEQGVVSGPLAVGAHLDRRVVGPLFIGAWGLSSGQGGLSLSLEF